MRELHYGKTGIVASLSVSADNLPSLQGEPLNPVGESLVELSAEDCCSNKHLDDDFEIMRTCLNNLGWDKHIVNFNSFLPVAHLQIVASRRHMHVYDLFNLSVGHEVMDHAARSLSTGADELSTQSLGLTISLRDP